MSTLVTVTLTPEQLACLVSAGDVAYRAGYMSLVEAKEIGNVIGAGIQAEQRDIVMKALNARNQYTRALRALKGGV